MGFPKGHKTNVGRIRIFNGKPKCLDCGKQIWYGSKRCILCSDKHHIRMKRPDVIERMRGNKYSLGRKQSKVVRLLLRRQIRRQKTQIGRIKHFRKLLRKLLQKE